MTIEIVGTNNWKPQRTVMDMSVLIIPRSVQWKGCTDPRECRDLTPLLVEQPLWHTASDPPKLNNPQNESGDTMQIILDCPQRNLGPISRLLQCLQLNL